ncbi:hypothetical protein MHH93_18075, partial [Priestia sp. FSL H7-0729]
METGPAPFRQGKTEQEARLSKTCMYCGQQRPMSEFRRRTGKRAGPGARRGACRSCRQLGGQAADHDVGSSVSGRTNERMESQRDGLETHAVTARSSASARYEAGRTSDGVEHGSATMSESDRGLVSPPSIDSSSSNDDQHADVVASSPSSSGIRKKRRRRRKSKRIEGMKGNEQKETIPEHDGLADEVVTDPAEPQPGERRRGEGHSQGHASANVKDTAQRAGARAAAAVQAAEQTAAAQV